MKNIDQTKNKLNTIFKRYGLILSLLFITLGYSGTAWGTDYYVLWGTSDNPANWNLGNAIHMTDQSPKFTCTMTGLPKSTNIYFGVSTTSGSLSGMFNASLSSISCTLTNHSEGHQNYGAYNFVRFSSSETSAKIEFNHDSPGTYTISAAGLAVATSITGGSISPTSATVSSGGNQSFTVTPSTGYVVTAVSYSGTATNNWTSGNTISLTNITSAGTLTVTCGPSVPVVRMGDIPTPNPATNEAVTAYAYLAKTGCANVTKLRIYIGKDGSPTKSSDYVEYTTGNPYSINNQYAITIPASKLNEIAGASSSFTAHIKATGFNSAGESELSDELTFTYQACPIGVEITPSSGEMLVGSPTTFSTSVSGAGGTQTYKWYVNDVEQSGQTSSTFGFTPTEAGSYAVKVEVTDDCTSSATANMTACNSPTISSLTVSSETTTPWEAVIITATVANTDNVVFTATGATIITTKKSSTEWEGKFKAGTVKTYVVTATATSSSSTCGSDTETVEIDVEADVEVCP